MLPKSKPTYYGTSHNNEKVDYNLLGPPFKMIVHHQKVYESLIHRLSKSARLSYRRQRALRSRQFTARDYGVVL